MVLSLTGEATVFTPCSQLHNHISDYLHAYVYDTIVRLNAIFTCCQEEEKRQVGLFYLQMDRIRTQATVREPWQTCTGAQCLI